MKSEEWRLQWAELSRFRGELMGFAMIAILLFHVGGQRHDTFAYCLSRCGNVGVDVFLFLSGIGLWFAWAKKPSLMQFYWRRYIRVYPAWFIIACLYFVPFFIDGKKPLLDTILNITFYHDFWTVYNELHFWYIPAIMTLYTIAPAYMALVNRSRSWCWLPVVAMLFCVLMRYDQSLYLSLRHIEIFISRIPIFLIGINVGAWVKEQREANAEAWIVVVLTLVLSAYVCINFESGLRNRFPLFLERMVYIPLCISLSLVVCRLFSVVPSIVCKAFSFVGTVSLEFYLIHVEFVLKHLKPLHLGYFPTALLTLAITLPLAWLLHKLLTPLGEIKAPSGSPKGERRIKS
ncbi:MAG: acyltransferase family protein [Prevotella sp.]